MDKGALWQRLYEIIELSSRVCTDGSGKEVTRLENDLSKSKTFLVSSNFCGDDDEDICPANVSARIFLVTLKPVNATLQTGQDFRAGFFLHCSQKE